MGGPAPLGKTVLVVEDNKSTRDIVVHNLAAAGFRTVEAADGEAAVQALGRQTVDVILLDVMMPKMDGFTVCRLLKQPGPTASIPIIIVTARNEREDVMKAVQSGADDYIVKPFTKDTLLEKVRKHAEGDPRTKPATKSRPATPGS
jgi:two-component system response regulator VicR